MNAVIYARYSSDNQREESIDAQLRICRKYCREKNYIVIHEYVDEAYTATNDKRPAYQQMIADSKSHTFQVAVFHKVNRNARNEFDYYANKAKLIRNGVTIEYAGQAFDSTTAEGQLMENQLIGMAAYFSRNLAREVKKGQNENALKCVHNGGIPPLGYDVGADKHYIVNEAEAEVIRFIFKMYIDGARYIDIINACNERGYRTKAGRLFKKNSLHDILSNKKYAGYYIYGKARGSRSMPRNSHRVSKDVVEVKGGIPAIIDEETWQKAIDRIKERKHYRAEFSAKGTYLLAGRIVCGECGARMQGSSYWQKRKSGDRFYSYYRCPHCRNRQVEKQSVEQYAIQVIRKCISSKRTVRAIVKSVNKSIKESASMHATEIQKINAQLDAINRANGNLMSLVETGGLDEMVKERLLQNAGKSKNLRERLRELQAGAPELLDANDVMEVLKAWRDIDGEEERKSMISSFVDTVTVSREMVSVNLFLTYDGIRYHSDKLLASIERSKI